MYFSFHSGQRGESGPVQVTDTHAYPEATEAFIKAAELQGFEVGDLNAEEMDPMAHKSDCNKPQCNIIDYSPLLDIIAKPIMCISLTTHLVLFS